MPAKVDPGAPVYLVSYAVVAAVSVLLWMQRRRWPGAAIAWLVFLAVIFPMLGVHQNGPQIAADRYTYHAAPALAILVGAGFALLRRRCVIRNASKELVPVRRTVVKWMPATLAAVVLFALGAHTWKQSEIWHDSTSLWSRVLAIDSSSSYGHNNWGNLLMRQDKVADATEHFARAIALTPDYAQAHNNLGIALARQGRLDDAIEHYQRALAIEPGYDEPQNNWGIAVVQRGDFAQGIEHYRQALAIRADNPDAQVNWGNALLRMGKPDEAIEHYRAALKIRPDDADAHLNWGVALAQQAKFDEAIEQFRQTLAIDPKYVEANQYLERSTQLLRQRPGDGRLR